MWFYKLNVMEKKFTKIVLLICCMVSIQLSFGQITITGKVTDSETGEPLIGVTVSLLGVTGSVTTNNEGNYSIQAVSTGTLKFTYVGYVPREVAVTNSTTLDVRLSQETSTLEQVVVVGYGTQSKRNITGSIESIDLSKTKDLPNVNITQSLGNVAGVQFIGNGRPGQEGSLMIRGQNSLSAANNPLIVLDGIIFNGSLSDISPNDILSIDILKDASSASIYGSRAANGVILITSKRGISERATLNFNAFYGISEYANKIKILGPERYIERLLTWRAQSELEADPSKITSYLSQTEAENYLNGKVTDPWDAISQASSTSSYNLNIAAKMNTTNFFLSGSLTDDKGLVYNDNEKRVTLRANIDNQIFKWLNLGMNASYSNRNASGIEGSVYNAYRSSPYGNWYYEDGEPTQYIVPGEQSSTNAMREAMLTQNKEIYNNLFSNFHIQAETPFLDGELSYRLNYSPNYRSDHNYSFFKQDKHLAINTTNANKYNRNAFDWVLENIVTYKRAIGEGNFDVTLLYGRDHSESETTTANASMFNIDALGYNNLGLGDILVNSSSAYGIEGISSMARLNYQLKRKYMVTVTARRDGSSVFAAENKYAIFPSVAVGWMVSDEPFLDKINFLDMMKLRISYGSVGNQAISPYQSLSLSDIQRYVYGDGGASSLGIITSTMGNSNLKWETTKTFNAALDFDLFEGRIGGTVELYNSNTFDLLVRRTIPTMNGFSSILTNVGQINNKGIEFTLNSVNLKSNTFEWNSSATFSYNKNTIVHLFRTDLDGDGKEDDDVANSWFIGHPINSFYNYAFDGIYQEGDSDIPSGFEPGFVRYKNLNHDDKVNAEDRTIVGSGGSPKYRIGFRNQFKRGPFSLSIILNSMLGWKGPFNVLNPHVPGRSINQYDGGWWTSENKSNSNPSLVYSNPLGASWYLSRDFVRIKDVSLSYVFQEPKLEKLNISSLQLFIAAKNLYTFTNWPGPDPESSGAIVAKSGDLDMFPMPRTFSLGLNIGF